MEKLFRCFKRKRRCFQRIAALVLAVCISAGSLPWTGYAGTAGRKTEAEVYQGEQESPGAGNGSNSEVSQSDAYPDIIHGFGTKIKEKKQKEIKVKVNQGNQGNQNGKSWNLQMIQSGTEGKQESSGRKIKVAVIDSGINFSTDLPVVVRKNFIPEDERSVLYEDPSGHGTAVAGIIAALDNDEGITGINPDVELYSARVLDANLEAPVERIVEAIDWAVEQEVDIINMSFGIARNVAELEAAVERAAEAGILLIAASGNGETIAYPAAYDEVIAVGSVTAEGIAAEQSAGGDALEIMAPGENILSSGIFGGVTGMSGTSMAAPHVAGAASVLMELNPEMSADYIRMLLNYSANLYGSPDEYGNGVLDLEYAIEINDKFKKIYEKHIVKEEKNEKKKEKQKEKFWGEVLKTIPENEKAVETFTELDVVEGMWGSTDHKDAVQYGVIGTQMSFTNEQMKILTYACQYPDVKDSGLEDMDDNPYHGFLWQRQYKIRIVNNKEERYDYKPLYNSNYIANYIFLTKLALRNGEAEKVACGTMLQNDYSRIYEDFKGGKIGSSSWSDVFKEVGVSDTDENRKMFIYGIAIHLITDVYSHSAWRLWGTGSGAQYERIKHSKKGAPITNTADDSNYIPKRYAAAKEAAYKVLVKANEGKEGTLHEFMHISSFYDGYYLGNFAAYAQMADSDTYGKYKVLFAYGDLWFNVLDGAKIDFEDNPILKAGE